ncbi:T9SS type A sorting domain-containing protein [Hymenobacter coalescens]
MNRLLLAAAGLGLSCSAGAQSITNHGAHLTVQVGTTLSVPDSLLNRAGSQLANAGTLQLGRTLSNGGTLTSAGLVRFGGSGRQRLVPGGAALARLEVNNAGAVGQNVLVVTDHLTITQELRLTGGLVRTPAARTISLPDGASVVGEGAGRYVQGNLRVTRSSVAGPVDFGHGAAVDGTGQDLGTVSITRTAGLQVAGSSYGTQLGAGTRGIDRIWTIEAAQQPTAPVPLTLSWPADDDNGLGSFAPAQVWRQAGSQDAWLPVGPLQNGSARSLSTSTTAFGRFTVSNAANPLPVVLLSFDAERDGKDALLRWTTAQEKNSAYFEVESSLDGRTFRALGRVAGRGTTTQRSDYSFTDPNLARYAAETVYYRLRQVDEDGTAALSPVRPVLAPLEAGLVVQAAPNPFEAAGLRVLMRAAQPGPATLTLTDAVGRTLLTQAAHLTKGANELALPQAGRLPEGVYLLRLQQGHEVQVLKVVRR